MLYRAEIGHNLTTIYNLIDDSAEATFDTQIFLEKVISPLEFGRYEKNMSKKNFNIRKLEIQIYKLK